MVFLVVGALLLWGAFWGLVRDQDGPYPAGKPNEDGNKWKEVGGAAWTLPFAGLTFLYGIDPWWLDVGASLALLGIGAVAFYAQHAILDSFRAKGDQPGNGTGLSYTPNRQGEYDVTECYVNLALGGFLLGLGPALYMAAAGHYVMPVVSLAFCAVYKPLCYKAAWEFFGHPKPGAPKYREPTFWGHVTHFALSVATSGGFLFVGA